MGGATSPFRTADAEAHRAGEDDLVLTGAGPPPRTVRVAEEAGSICRREATSTTDTDATGGSGHRPRHRGGPVAQNPALAAASHEDCSA
ncbi:hypothetical protein [Arsenicicoccus dermatophilus]|uniref:hypothetical protein n=1 Tax=Arsenicicoccus dermatophilus TaxID=1076331 RepID=UPI001F4CF040|nr:hypothetical protein [Arsenicicoccus dermatophilus]MCH8612371.1 hypothetical protein [Arsenicicoccus dermatophilus]